MKVTLASSLCLAALAAFSFAGDDKCKVVIENPCSFYVQAVGGASFFASGDLLEAVDVDKYNFLNGVGFDDIYETAATYGLRVGKACENGRMYVGFEYTEASSDAVEIGHVWLGHDPSVVAQFSDYSDYALVFGVERNLFGGGGGGKCVVAPRKFRPWVGAQVGIRFVDGISAHTQLIDPYGSLLDEGEMGIYDDSVVFTAAFTLGLAYDLTENITIGVESGLRWQTSLDEVDDDLNVWGFGAANDDSDLLAVPVLGTVAIKF